MAISHAQMRAEEYQWIIASRFDLGQIDKHNGYQRYKVSEINFNPLLDSQYIYTALWDQTNAGIADQWVYGNQGKMASLVDMGNDAITYLSQGSEYLEWLKVGVPCSNQKNPFSNEILKPPSLRSKNLRIILKKDALDNHLMHKFFFTKKELLESNALVSHIDGFARVLYTHTDYSDCWPMYFGQVFKYANLFEKNYVFVNSFDSRIPDYFIQIEYDDKMSYTDRLQSCLSSVNENYIFFEHEDMIILRAPEVSQLINYARMIKTSGLDKYRRSKFDVIKLVNGGKYFSSKVRGKNINSLRRISRLSPWIFSIQPSLWNKSSLITLLREHPQKSIWEFEIAAQRSLRKFRFRSALVVETTPKRGTGHYDSNIYPFIATAIVKGKWNLLEYGSEINELSIEYGIDLSIRGSNVETSR